MKTRDQIYDIIVNQLGITDLAAYKQYQDKKADAKLPLTADEIELLSPDNIDNIAFWSVCNELFQNDPISNCMSNELDSDIFASNQRNLMLARGMGMLGWLEAAAPYFHEHFSLLEIGAGLGCFRNYLESRYYFSKYLGVDVLPQTFDTIATTQEGLLPVHPKLSDASFEMAYSSNVFQHLTDNQRQNYIKEISRILKPNGIFLVNLLSARNDCNDAWKDAQGNHYIMHYGQYTRIPTWDQFQDAYLPYFQCVYYTCRTVDNLSSFFLTKRKGSNPKNEQSKTD